MWLSLLGERVGCLFKYISVIGSREACTYSHYQYQYHSLGFIFTYVFIDGLSTWIHFWKLILKNKLDYTVNTKFYIYIISMCIELEFWELVPDMVFRIQADLRQNNPTQNLYCGRESRGNGERHLFLDKYMLSCSRTMYIGKSLDWRFMSGSITVDRVGKKY